MTIRYTAHDLAQLLNVALPTKQQSAVIEAPLESLLTMAGAGAGKTTTIALRMCYLIINEIVPAPQILGLTFTRKACGELEHKIRQFMQKLLNVLPAAHTSQKEGHILIPSINTYHAYCIDVVRTYGLLEGVDPEFRVIGQTQTWQAVHRFVRMHGEEIYALINQALSPASKWAQRTPERIVTDILTMKTEMTEHQVSVDEINDYTQCYMHHAYQWEVDIKKPVIKDQEQKDTVLYRHIIASYVPRVCEYLMENKTVDYDLLIHIVDSLTHHYPLIRIHEHEKYPAVFLDEYQDTSEAQRRFLSRLYGYVGGGSPASAVQAVGDPLQTIYGWRGASAMNLRRFQEDFRTTRTHARTEFLNQSWRNSLAVLNFANYIALPLRSENFFVPELDSSPRVLPGKITLAHWGTSETEAQAIAQQIQQLRAQEPTSTIAVLLRRNQDAPVIAAALSQAQIAHHISSLSGLLQLPHIQEILAWLALIDGDDNDEYILLLFAGPKWNFGVADLTMLHQWRTDCLDALIPSPDNAEDSALQTQIAELFTRRSLSLLNCIMHYDVESSPLSEQCRQRVREFRWQTQYARKLATINVNAVLDYVINHLGINQYYYYSHYRYYNHHYAPGDSHNYNSSHDQGDSYGNVTRREQSTIDTFLDVFRAYQQEESLNGRVILGEFLYYCRSAIEHEGGLDMISTVESNTSVAIMTIHAAKGLEFDHVFIAAISPKAFPSEKYSSTWITHASYIPAPLRKDTSYSRDDFDAFPAIDWPPEDRKSFWKNLDEHKKILHERSAYEERRLWYVAVTRAKNQIFLSGNSLTNISDFLSETYDYAQKNPGSVDILAWEEPQEDDALLSENEVSDELIPISKYIDEENDEENIVWPTITRSILPSTQLQAAEKIIANLARKDIELPHTLIDSDRCILDRIVSMTKNGYREELRSEDIPGLISVSQLITEAMHYMQWVNSSRTPLTAETIENAGKKAENSRYTAAVLGTQFHQWVQNHADDPALLTVQDLPGAADDVYSSAPNLIEKWIHNYAQSSWSQRYPIAVEQPFTLFLQGRQIRGRIDAIFYIDNQYVIVDWKTGHKKSHAALKPLFMQLALYRLAWATLKNIPVKTVRAFLYFVDSNIEIELDPQHDHQYLSDITGLYPNDTER